MRQFYAVIYARRGFEPLARPLHEFLELLVTDLRRLTRGL